MPHTTHPYNQRLTIVDDHTDYPGPTEPPEPEPDHEPSPTTTADIFQIARTSEHASERHSATRYVVKWRPRDMTCGEPLPPKEEAFSSRIDAIEYAVEVAPMAFAAPVMVMESWLYDPELYIHEGRKRFGWWPIARFELVSTRGGDVLVEVPLESPN